MDYFPDFESIFHDNFIIDSTVRKIKVFIDLWIEAKVTS